MSKKTTDSKIKVLVSIPRSPDYSKRAIVDYVRDAVRSSAGAFLPPDFMVEYAKKATAKEYKGEPVVDTSTGMDASTAAILYALGLDDRNDAIQFLRYWNEGDFDIIRANWENVPDEVFAGADAFHPNTKEMLEEEERLLTPTLSTVQILNEVVRGINSIAYMPPETIRHNRREFWKAGARACLQKLNESVQESAKELLGAKRPQPIDGELFNYWVEEASRNPVRVAKALAHCVKPDDYRAALWIMVKEDEERMTGVKPVLNPEGGLV